MNPNGNSNLSQHYLQIQALTPVVQSDQSPPTEPISSSAVYNYTTSIIVIFISLLVIGSVSLLITKTRHINKLIMVLFIAFVTSAIPLTMNTLSQQQSVQTQAINDYVPTNLIITQVSSNGFTVIWDTNKPNTGTIRIWDELGKMSYNQIFSESDAGQIYKHVIVVKDLQPITTYNFEILSGGDWYNNYGSPLQVTTHLP